MRIAHISDLHIRNQKYRDEYRSAFEDLYERLEGLRPDLVINTGDTVHSKLAVSPELFDDVAYHCIDVCRIAPYWIILGNHDLNLKNRGRTDAISPVVRALQGRTESELRLLDPGSHHLSGGDWSGFSFWNYDIRGHEDFFVKDSHVNIGLYHGQLAGCTTDIGYLMEEGEPLESFQAMDYVLLGDIHKRQSFRSGRIWYAGSLIQQNYGEDREKGFLLWDIEDKENFRVDFHPIKAPGRFYTIQVPADLDVSTVSVPPGSRIKALVAGELSPSRRWELEKIIREQFSPLEIITPDPSSGGLTVSGIDDLVGSREELARSFLRDKGCDDAAIEEALALYKRYESALGDEGSARGTTWKLNCISWDNMMNYGEENVLDLTKLSGLVGIFAPNASGKSSIFDILLQALFDKVSKDVPRNIDLVNDNRDSARMRASFESNGRAYLLERTIERIHYGQRKLPETKQWGKTSLELSADDESLNGDSRPETERTVRRIIGSFEDFVLTTMLSQAPIFGLPGGADILNCKETDRRKILFRFLDLDSYEGIHGAVRDDLKELMGGLKADRDRLVARSVELAAARDGINAQIIAARGGMFTVTADLGAIRQGLAGAMDVERSVRELAAAEREERELERMLAHDRTALIDAEETERMSRAALDSHLGARPLLPEISLEDVAARVQSIEDRLLADRERLGTTRAQMRQGERSLGTLDDIPCEGKFPTCRFISDALVFVDQREAIRTAIEELTAAVGAAEAERADLEQHRVVHRSFSEWDRRRGELGLTLARSEDRAAAARATVESRTRLLCAAGERTASARGIADMSSHERIQELRNEEARLIRERDARQTELDGLMCTLGVASANADSARDELTNYDSLKGRALVHERVMDLCGKNGLPYRILGMMLPLINAEIAKILSGTVKFSVFFEDDPEGQTVSLFIRYGDYKSRPLALGSGAEKFIASLAIRAALLSVSSLPKTDILIVDEGFGKLDPEHLESVQRIFETLRASFRTIFLISHVDSMRDIVDHSIDIISRAGYAHVEVT